MSVHARIVLEVELPASKRSAYDDNRRVRTLAGSLVRWAARNRWVTRARVLELTATDGRWHDRDLLTTPLAEVFGEPIPEPAAEPNSSEEVA